MIPSVVRPSSFALTSVLAVLIAGAPAAAENPCGDNPCAANPCNTCAAGNPRNPCGD